ncbi:hypothetical protein [Blastococcus sp. SYSU D00695]
MTTPTPTAVPPRRAGRPRPRRRAGVLAAGFLVVSSFQVALAAGAPFGAAAFGGGHPGQLPADLRAASAAAAVVWLAAAGHALSRGGWLAAPAWTAHRRISWALAAVCTVGTLMNAASSSPWERFGWAPFTLGLALLCRALARSGAAGR